MKIENWTRTDYGIKKTQWRHDTGVVILLIDVGPFYRLSVYDTAGRETWYDERTNRTELEQMSAKYQRSYNRHLKKINY